MRCYNIAETGSRIRTLRKSTGHTQEALSELLDLDRSYLGQVETGKKGCSVDVLIRMSEIFHVSLDYLILGNKLEQDDIKETLDDLIQNLTRIRDTL